MRLMQSKSPNATSLYVIKSLYENGKHSTKIVEKLGTVAELTEKLNGADPIEWAKQYIEQLNQKEAQGIEPDVLVSYSPEKFIGEDERRLYNGGYLFLQSLYYGLGLHKICADISSKHSFAYDLNSILSRLVYGRLIFPHSKLATCTLAERFIEGPDFKLQHIYRALAVLAQESDFIQASLFKNSCKLLGKRHTGVIYYDCTNYFFESEFEDGLRRYGVSKEHRPNPVVQMGLFMDSEGIPLAFSITPGNINEQQTMRPLEEKLLKEFELSKFVVCTDAGLSSTANRVLNDVKERAFVTTQSIKKLKGYLMDWALAKEDWKSPGDETIYNLDELDKILEGLDAEAAYKFRNKIFYKERGVKEDGLKQNFIVTYSLKYRDYQRSVRARQIERAAKVIETNPGKMDKCNANDYRRFIKRERIAADGTTQVKERLYINTEQIEKEAKFDGFYGVCTNLDDSPEVILKIMRWRWEIEECFRIMKSEFKARPVFLRRDDRIEAHFLTCFITLLIYRLLEKKLEYKFTCTEIVDGLRQMDFLKLHGNGYIPAYKKTPFTDALHEAFGFRTDRQIVSTKKMKEIFKQTTSDKTLLTFAKTAKS